MVLLVLIGWGVLRMKGRFSGWRKGSKELAAPAAAAGATENAGAPGTFSPAETDVGLAGRNGEGGEEVDPLEEAEIFLAYGRDAQAEELLQEAIAAHPTRFEIHLKLLEIYAKQKNGDAFEKLARVIQQEPGSEGDTWERVAALGRSFDPENPRYASDGEHAGAGSDEDAMADDGPSTVDVSSSTDQLDFDVGDSDEAGSDPDASTSGAADIDLSDSSDLEKTQVLGTTNDLSDEPANLDADISIDLPPVDDGSGSVDLSVDDGGNTVDFEFESDKPLDISAAPDDAAEAEEPAAESFDAGLDFDVNEISLDSGDADGEPDSAEAPALDLSGISLDLDETATTTGPAAEASGKDDKWYEVQTKFDLAKAYQEMGDNDGAREILKEVISEGDSEQKAAAESVLSSLE